MHIIGHQEVSLVLYNYYRQLKKSKIVLLSNLIGFIGSKYHDFFGTNMDHFKIYLMYICKQVEQIIKHYHFVTNILDLAHWYHEFLYLVTYSNVLVIDLCPVISYIKPNLSICYVFKVYICIFQVVHTTNRISPNNLPYLR